MDRNKLLRSLFRASVRLGAPRTSGVLLSLMTSKINNNGKKRILYLGSEVSLNDIEAMTSYSGQFQYLRIERWHFRRVLEKYVPYSDLTEKTYHHDEKYREGLKKANTYIDKLFGVYRLIWAFDAVMTSNIGYIEQQELFSICKRRNVPIVVLYREGIANSYELDRDIKGWQNKKAICDLFICNGHLVKKRMLKNGVKGLTEDNMKVCGIPRLDVYKHKKVDPGRRPRLVYFTYKTKLKIERYAKSHRTIEEAMTITRDFNRHVFRLAEERPDIDVVVKTKLSYPLLVAVTEEAEEFYKGRPMPENLTITRHGYAEDLILGSRWVLGASNSTVVLEALIARRLVACPDFNDLLGRSDWDLFEGPTGLISLIKSYQDLIDFIDHSHQAGGYDDEADRFLARYFYRTDGRSSVRVENEIMQLVNQ